MKKINIILVLMVLTMSIFTGCNSSKSNNDNITVEDTNITEEIPIIDTNTTEEPITVVDTNRYIIKTLENKDIPTTATMLALSDDTKVKITRDVESDTMNVDVLAGSVEVIE